jgi:hypothetical protein
VALAVARVIRATLVLVVPLAGADTLVGDPPRVDAHERTARMPRAARNARVSRRTIDISEGWGFESLMAHTVLRQ